MGLTGMNSLQSMHVLFGLAAANGLLTAPTKGPHGLSHSSLAFRLHHFFQSMDAAPNHFTSEILMDEQLLTDEDYEKQFEEEMPTKLKGDKRRRVLKRAKLDYTRLRSHLKTVSARRVKNKTLSSRDRRLAYELMMRLMQMDPYTAYGKDTQGKRRMKFKNEKENDLFSKAFDKNASQSFRAPENYEKFKNRRKKLYPYESDSNVASAASGGLASTALNK